MITFPRSHIKFATPSLRSIYSKIEHALANLQYNFVITTTHTKPTNIATGDFLTPEIADKITSTMNRLHTINCTYKDAPIQHDIYVYTSANEKLSKNTVEQIVKRVLLFCELLQNRNVPKITIYMLNLPKRIHFMAEIMKNTNAFQYTTASINSGYHSISTGEIVIFRSEEVLKVLLHELIHFHKLDTLPSGLNSTIISHYKLPPNNDYHWNEGKTEAIAIIMHHMLLATTSITKQRLASKMQFEVNWNMFQMAKILFHTNKKLVDTSKLTSISSDNLLSRLQQQTCVFSYFFLKTLLLLQDSNLLEVHNLSQYTAMLTNDEILTDGLIYYINILKKQISSKMRHKTHTRKKGINTLLDTMRMSYPIAKDV